MSVTVRVGVRATTRRWRLGTVHIGRRVVRISVELRLLLLSLSSKRICQVAIVLRWVGVLVRHSGVVCRAIVNTSDTDL